LLSVDALLPLLALSLSGFFVVAIAGQRASTLAPVVVSYSFT